MPHNCWFVGLAVAIGMVLLTVRAVVGGRTLVKLARRLRERGLYSLSSEIHV